MSWLAVLGLRDEPAAEMDLSPLGWPEGWPLYDADLIVRWGGARTIGIERLVLDGDRTSIVGDVKGCATQGNAILVSDLTLPKFSYSNFRFQVKIYDARAFCVWVHWKDLGSGRAMQTKHRARFFPYKAEKTK